MVGRNLAQDQKQSSELLSLLRGELTGRLATHPDFVYMRIFLECPTAFAPWVLAE